MALLSSQISEPAAHLSAIALATAEATGPFAGSPSDKASSHANLDGDKDLHEEKVENPLAAAVRLGVGFRAS